MRRNTKSSITLPPKELKLVLELKAKLGAESNVEDMRRCRRDPAGRAKRGGRSGLWAAAGVCRSPSDPVEFRLDDKYLGVRDRWRGQGGVA
jgi:hypothetical protein